MKGRIRACSKRASTGVRNRALIVVLYRAGLRISEALALLPKDLDAQASTIRVLHGKGDHDRVVGLDAVLGQSCNSGWTAGPPSASVAGAGVLYARRAAGEAGLRSYPLATAACKAGIDKRVHAHGLRHTHAFELATEGTPLHIIQCQLGHSSVATTDRYIKHLNLTPVVETMKARAGSL